MNVPKDAFCIFRDGNQWACTAIDFVNLQESPSGFGNDIYEAITNYQENALADVQKRLAMKEGTCQ